MFKRLKYASDKLIDAVWASPEKFYEMMKLNPNNPDFVKDFLGEEPFIDSEFEFDFEFVMNDDDKNGSDYQNAINLYELFQENGIGRATVYNEKFLIGFIFTFGYEYFFWEMGLDQQSKIFGPLFFGDRGPRRAIAYNVISRLYRMVEMTVDETLDDKYELTKFVFKNRPFTAMVFYTNLDGPKAHRALIKAGMRWQKETGTKINTEMFRSFRKKITIFADINKIELMDEKDVIDKFAGFICESALERQ